MEEDEDPEAVKSERLSIRWSDARVGDCACPARCRAATGRGMEEEATEGEEDMIMVVSGR